jgi:hypothetical protein
MATLVPPPVPPAAIPRAVPQTTVEKWNAWRFWSSYWSWAYILTGSLLSLVSTVVAANTKTQFLGGRASITIACAAAVLTFRGERFGRTEALEITSALESVVPRSFLARFCAYWRLNSY